MTIQNTAWNHKPIAGALCLAILFSLSQLVCAYHLAEHAEIKVSKISEDSSCELCLYGSHSAVFPRSTPEFTPPETLSGLCLYLDYCSIKNSSELAAIRAPPSSLFYF